MTGSQQWSKDLTGRLLLRAGLQHVMEIGSVLEQGSSQSGDLGPSWFSSAQDLHGGKGRPWSSAKVKTEVREKQGKVAL